MGTYFIYGLEKEGLIFYIGITDSLNRRHQEHKIIFGENIGIKKLEEYTGSLNTAQSLEQFWIKKYIDLGIKIKNKNTFERIETIGGICLNCRKDLISFSGKRGKQFCNSTCRSNYWQKKKRKLEKINIKDLTIATNMIKPFEQPKTNFTIDTTKPIMPEGLNWKEQLEWTRNFKKSKI